MHQHPAQCVAHAATVMGMDAASTDAHMTRPTTPRPQGEGTTQPAHQSLSAPHGTPLRPTSLPDSSPPHGTRPVRHATTPTTATRNNHDLAAPTPRPPLGLPHPLHMQHDHLDGRTDDAMNARGTASRRDPTHGHQHNAPPTVRHDSDPGLHDHGDTRGPGPHGDYIDDLRHKGRGSTSPIILHDSDPDSDAMPDMDAAPRAPTARHPCIAFTLEWDEPDPHDADIERCARCGDRIWHGSVVYADHDDHTYHCYCTRVDNPRSVKWIPEGSAPHDRLIACIMLDPFFDPDAAGGKQEMNAALRDLGIPITEFGETGRDRANRLLRTCHANDIIRNDHVMTLKRNYKFG